jgi:hypothetical protein
MHVGTMLSRMVIFSRSSACRRSSLSIGTLCLSNIQQHLTDHFIESANFHPKLFPCQIFLIFPNTLSRLLKSMASVLQSSANSPLLRTWRRRRQIRITSTRATRHLLPIPLHHPYRPVLSRIVLITYRRLYAEVVRTRRDLSRTRFIYLHFHLSLRDYLLTGYLRRRTCIILTPSFSRLPLVSRPLSSVAPMPCPRPHPSRSLTFVVLFSAMSPHAVH